MGMSLFVRVQAGPVELPDSARPGAVRPEQEATPVKPDAQAATTTDVLEIPSVIDRPLSVEECPCVIAKQFRLLNAEDMPEFNITLADVQKILDEKLQQQPEQGFSIGQLTEVANAARNYYREKGLILSQVVVPVQTVQGGVVDLELLIGKLGRVLTEGNVMYSQEVLQQAFRSLRGKPINKADIEAALLRLTDYPGLTIFGVFQPGQMIGTADLVLKVQKEKRFDVAMRVDNEGTRETGKNRFRTVIDWNNPTDGADRLSATIQQTYTDKSSDFRSIEYKHYLGDGSYLFKAFVDHDAFDLRGDFISQEIHNETEDLGIEFSKSFIRSRITNLSGTLGFTGKKSWTRSHGTQISIDQLSVFSLGVDYDLVDNLNLFGAKEGGGGLNFANIEISHGVNDLFGAMGSANDASLRPNGERPSRRGRGNQEAAGKFTKLFAKYSRLQTVRKNINLLGRLEYQWSPDLLVPVEQYSVGGADNVRAFPAAQILWDRALFYSFELFIGAPFIADQPAFANRTWGELLQLGIFYDSVTGRLNSPTNSDKVCPDCGYGYQTLKGAGLGLHFNLPGSIDSRLFWAWEIGGDKINNDKRPAIWGDFTYSF
jgi:hemolysin activation/secretion protein